MWNIADPVSKLKILTVIGNRPQFIKAAAVSRHLRAVGEEILVHTGQHYDHELSEIFFEELELPPPEHMLGVGAGSHAEQTARTMIGLEPLVADTMPDAVLVYGDTNATAAGALVAAKARVPLAHVEAGMRSFDMGMPEEVNRVVADRLSGLLLCSTQTAVDNLAAEGQGDHARLVGDVMADVALAFGPIADRRSTILDTLELSDGAYLLATAHRAENVDDPDRLGRLVDILIEAGADAPVVFPVHPRTRARLEASGLDERLRGGAVMMIAPVGYLDLTRLLHGSRALLTDSGCLQKEAYLAGVPCVTMRPVTEWVETVESGWNRLVDLDPVRADEALRELAPLRDGPPPDAVVYGGGTAGVRVVDELGSWLG
jgi:UDP-N-acetylglucosamine 2-epimerase (non-hydrolysing)/UDP-GlcNAc3NAcA epimerase